MRDRLIELLENCEHISYLDSVYDLPNIYNLVADYLLANGVIVPPAWCRKDDVIYWHGPDITGVDLVRERIVGFGYGGFYHKEVNRPTYFTPFTEYGKTVFLTKEEAEEKLKEMQSK